MNTAVPSASPTVTPSSAIDCGSSSTIVAVTGTPPQTAFAETFVRLAVKASSPS